MSLAKMICILATMLALSVGCFAQAPRVIAQKLYDQLGQANANQNLNQVLGFYDSSYVSTDVQGKRAGFAELRKEKEQGFAVFRHMNPSTIVEAAQLGAGRMVVYYKTETHYEFNDQRYCRCWAPQIYTATGEDTWERKGGEWKLVQSKVFRADTQVDARWAEEQKAIINNHYEAAKRVAESMNSNNRH
jgi:hypothetical protein